MATFHDGENKMYTHRVSDLLGETGKMLTPIQGYENMPLVSLEAAVEPLVQLLPDIRRMAYIAKEKCEQPPRDHLSLDESASIIIYTMDWTPVEVSLYHVLNSTLRDEDRQRLKPWFLYLKLVLTALSRLPSKHRSVYRGLNTAMPDQYKKGKIMTWWGFSSCTSTLDVLNQEIFLKEKGSRTMFHIECETGKDIQKHSQFQNEEEILLLPARQFQVVACLKQPDDLYIVQMKEIKPPYPLLDELLPIVCQIMTHFIFRLALTS